MLRCCVTDVGNAEVHIPMISRLLSVLGTGLRMICADQGLTFEQRL